MQRFIAFLVVLAIGYFAYGKYQERIVHVYPAPEAASHPVERARLAATTEDTSTASPFSCDGRTRCSQMTSCAEATFFLKNCPGVKMDGDHDGIPCERQWCTEQ